MMIRSEMESTPISLLERLGRPGQGEAWARFVELYTDVLFAWGRRLGLRDADAADLVQEVFALLVQKLPAFDYDHSKSFRAWLRTLTLNKWRELNRRKQLPTDAGVPLEEIAEAAADDDFWEREYVQHLAAQALTVMRADFEPTTWRACWSCVAEGRPVAEIARELGLSENAVYIAKFRVLRRLHQELKGLVE